ncbi:MAG: OPT/YSL family transporter [bacterium]|nr:OPT/YSL family transporter [bacterium]
MLWKGSTVVPAIGSSGRYPEWTVRITIFALFLGTLATVSSVYSGLKIAQVLGASAAAVTLGMAFKAFRGSILEVNIGQIVTSTINVSAAGVIFTIPALYILKHRHPEMADFGLGSAFVATIAGALIGATVIVPLRRRFIEIDVLPFPGGTAMATVVRAPGIPVRSIVAFVLTMVIAGVVEVMKHNGTIPEELAIGDWLGLPSYTGTALMMSLLTIALGTLSGKGGLPFLFGGVVAWWILAPFAANVVVTPETLPTINPGFQAGGDYAAGIGAVLLPKAFRPIGIGMFLGAAIVGAVLAYPVLRGIIQSMRNARRTRSELSLRFIAIIVAIGAIAIFAVALRGLPMWRAMLVVTVGLGYLVVANMVVTDCSARGAPQPVSGLSFVGAVLTFLISGGDVVIAVFLAAAICSGITQGGDMMDDLKTAHLIGADTWKAQVSQIAVTAIGPVVALITVMALAKGVGFGEASAACAAVETCKVAAACTPELTALKATCLPAPQATALASLLDGLSQPGFPYGLYGGGAILGGFMTLLPVGGAGVLFGIAFYLPFSMTLAFGLGCLMRIGINRVASQTWVDRYLVPIAAGIILGESLVGTYFALDVARGIFS